MSKEIIQYVGFRTDLPATAFRVIWTPVALAFKMRGIQVIDLYQFAEGAQVAFMSRNIWKSDDYLQVFPSGLADAAVGPVEVIQFGGYFSNGVDGKTAEVVETLSVLFTQSNLDESENAQIFKRVTNSVPYRFASENFGNVSNAETPLDAHTLGDVKLIGTHIARL